MEQSIGEVCIPNISTAERRKRLRGGAFAFGFGLIVLAGMLVLDVNPWWRLALYPVFAGAATGYFQWRDKT